jgi:predicted naringenin-chalcone synthase
MQIVQLSTFLPKNEYSTEKLIEKFPCRLPEAVVQNVLNLGVSKRYLINPADLTARSETLVDETDLVDMCSNACQEAIQKADLHPRDINYFATAYDTNPFLSPGLSQLLIPQLDLDRCVRYVNAQGIASTAFLKTLQLSEDYLASHPKDNVLICVSGVSSFWFQNQVRGLKNVMEIGKIGSIHDKKRKQTELRKWIATMQFFLFGDGVAAAILSNKSDGLKVDKIVEVTNVHKKDCLAGYARLSSLGEPFRFGFHSHLSKQIPDLGAKYTSLALDRLFGNQAKNRIKAAKKWAVHTGSEKILDTLAEHHGIEKEKLRESHEVLRENGNLSGASLPFILQRIVSTGKFSRGDTILMLGYGWGFSASAGALEFRC